MLQTIHQMPDTALDPRHSIEEILGRPVTLYEGLRGDTRRERVRELPAKVELDTSLANRYPLSLSGGQKIAGDLFALARKAQFSPSRFEGVTVSGRGVSAIARHRVGHHICNRPDTVVTVCCQGRLVVRLLSTEVGWLLR